jgi:hypothetical protein
MAIRSEQQETEKTFASEHLPHYGALLGGPKEIVWSGIGEFSIGPGLDKLPRRELVQFNSFQCGGRIESVLGEEALSPRYSTMTDLQWAKSEKRIMDKAARSCAEDVFQIHGREGWAILKSLTGKNFDTASDLFSSVLPTEVAAKSLVAVIVHLEALDFPLGDPRFALKAEMLKAAQTSQTHYTTYTAALRDEISNAAITGMGLKSLNDASAEIFRELDLDLPAQAAKKQNVEMGKAIAQAVTAQQPAQVVPGLQELVAALLEQNRILKEQHASNEQSQDDTTDEPQIKKAA